MVCRSCQAKGKCIDSRGAADLETGIRRRYACLACGERWSSLEVRVDDNIRSERLFELRAVARQQDALRVLVIDRLENLLQEVRGEQLRVD